MISDFDEVLRSAARLQELVPDAVLVGGSAAVLYARHRISYDHDHVLADLNERFDAVLEALETDPEWVLNRAVPGKILLGSLGDIEVGIRQLIRRRPLETQIVEIPSGGTVVAPTPEETLRIKAYLLVKRNQVRDYIDLAALADRFGVEWAANTLADIDAFYDQRAPGEDAVAAQVLRQLGQPRPADSRAIAALDQYKELAPKWQSWPAVVAQCQAVADAMIG
ncbi:MAG: nucleotidyl transferase AbiEii/AbiGii toxin family protein [Mycobacterium sp.]